MKSIKQLKILNIILNIMATLGIATFIVFGAIGSKVGLVAATILLILVIVLKCYSGSRKYAILFKELNSKIVKQIGKRKYSISLLEQKKFIVLEVRIEDNLPSNVYSDCYEMLNQYFDNVEDIIKKPPLIQVFADKYL